MAEIGVVASVIQVADTGLRLSIKLCTFGELVASADKSVASISKDISLTSLVLKELGEMLNKDCETQKLTLNAVKTADSIVKECLNVFEEMETMIVKKLPNLRAPDAEKASRASVLLERLKWPYIQPKLTLLQSRLDKLKSTTLLMLNVIIYARQNQLIAARDTTDHSMTDQVSLIEGLAKNNRDKIKAFEDLKSESETNSSFPAFRPNLDSGAGKLNPTTYTTLFTESKSKDKPNSTELDHYMELLTTLLNEADRAKHCVTISSHSRVREGLHDMFDKEMDFLADAFEDPQQKLMKDYFASLVVASKNKWSLLSSSNPQQSSNSVKSSMQARQMMVPPPITTPMRQMASTHGPSFPDYEQYARGYSSSLSISSSRYGDSIYQSMHDEDKSTTDPVAEETPFETRCWDHGCNGRQMKTFSNLLRHQREKSGISVKSACQRCGAEFTRKTARDAHLAHDKCKQRTPAAPRLHTLLPMKREREEDSNNRDGDNNDDDDNDGDVPGRVPKNEPIPNVSTEIDPVDLSGSQAPPPPPPAKITKYDDPTLSSPSSSQRYLTLEKWSGGAVFPPEEIMKLRERRQQQQQQDQDQDQDQNPPQARDHASNSNSNSEIVDELVKLWIMPG